MYYAFRGVLSGGYTKKKNGKKHEQRIYAHPIK